MKVKNKNKIRNLLLLLLIVIMAGTIGYMLIEHYSFLEALFMTIITITTVGYGTIHNLSQTGIIFTILLITSSFIIVGFIVQNLTKYISDGELKKILVYRKINRVMKKMQNHVIVCGYGLNGAHAVSELLSNDENVVVIDNSDNIDDFSLKAEDAIFIKGNAKDEEILKQAKIENAKALIATLSTDADNLFVVLTARELNPNLKIVARANEDSSDHKLRYAGADYVILPDSVGGVRMAKLVTEPDVIEFMENILAKSGISVNLVEIECSEKNTELLDKSIYELDVRKKSGANIVGIKLADGTYVFNPSADMKITEGTKLFILGTPEQVEIFKDLTIKK